jgi:hypothetical protein
MARVGDIQEHLIRSDLNARRYQRILLLICPNGIYWFAVGGSIERPCAVKKRPAWKYGSTVIPSRKKKLTGLRAACCFRALSS